jgi:hypothetical protein
MVSSLQFLVGLGIAGVTTSAQAQNPSKGQTVPDPSVQHAVATITASDFRAKLGALAHDSTRGRETPSPELARATEWVAEQFRNAGLDPGGDDGGYLQRFEIQHTRLDSLAAFVATEGGQRTAWTFGTDLIFVGGSRPVELSDAPVVLLVGTPGDTAHPFGDVAVRGAVVLHVLAPDELNGRVLNPVHRRADAEGVVAHIVASQIPADRWSRFARNSFPERWEVSGATSRGGLRVFGLQLEAVSELLRGAGEDPALLMTAEWRVRPLPNVTVSMVPYSTTTERATVANVVGVLEGSDLALRDEAVVFTSHMDHVGVIPGRCNPSEAVPSDSICNGADDNASGTVGVIELAEAFATLGRRSARTVVFAAMTAEERGLFGSRFYVEHPRVPLAQTAAVLNLDMIARNPPDTVGFLGKDYTSLGQVIDRVAGEHPELRLVPAEHKGRFTASDHFPFVERGVPALFFFSGEHEDLHTAADNPNRTDPDQAARIVRLAFLAGLAVADAPERPTWDPEAQARYVGP